MSHRVELVVARNDLGQPGTGLAENREVTEQVEQAAMLEHAFDQCREFRRTFRGNVRSVGGAPGHEALKVCRERPHPRCNAVRSDQQRVGVEQRRNLLLVGLQLVECT